MTTPDLEVIKDIPGYKVILKAVLKSQIQQLVEQLASTTDEESVILTASVSDGTLSHLGSDSGKFFLDDHEDIKSQFLGFCLKRHHKKKQEKEQQDAMRNIQATPPRYGYMQVRPRQPSPRQHNPIPISLTRAGLHSRPSPYPRGRPPRQMVPNFGGTAHPSPRLAMPGSGGSIIKIEPESDDSNQSASEQNTNTKPAQSGVEGQPSSQSSSPSPSTSAAESPNLPKLEALERGDESEPSNQNEGGVSDNMPAEGLSLDSDLSNLIPGESAAGEAGTSVSEAGSDRTSELDQSVNVKTEAMTDSEMELEITGVEPGQPLITQDTLDTWGQGSSGTFDMGATGNQADMSGSEQGYNIGFASARAPPKLYSCDICGALFGRADFLDRHRRRHTGEKPFMCRLCPFASARKDGLKKHLAGKHAMSITNESFDLHV